MNSKEWKLATWDAVFDLSESKAADLLAEASKMIDLPLSTNGKTLYVDYKDLVKTGRSVHGPRNLAQAIARWQNSTYYPGVNIQGRNYPDTKRALAFFACVPPYPAVNAPDSYDQDKQDAMYEFLQNALGVREGSEAEPKATKAVEDNTEDTTVQEIVGPVQIDKLANPPRYDLVWAMAGVERLVTKINLFRDLPADQASQLLINACRDSPVNVRHDDQIGAYCTRADLRRAGLSSTGPKDYVPKAKLPFEQKMVGDTLVYDAPQMLAYLTRTSFRGAGKRTPQFEAIRFYIAKTLGVDTRVFLRPDPTKIADTQTVAPKVKADVAPKTPKTKPVNEGKAVESSKTEMPALVASGSWDRVESTIKERMAFLMEQKRLAEENGIPWGFVIQGIL